MQSMYNVSGVTVFTGLSIVYVDFATVGHSPKSHL